MPVLIVSYGGKGDTSFITLVGANSIIENTQIYFDEWAIANTIQQGVALIKASRQISHRRWAGRKIFASQALAFPRALGDASFPWGAIGTDEPSASFFTFVASNDFQREMRERVERATAYQALYVLKNAGEDPHRESQYQGLGGMGRGYRMNESWSYRDYSQVLSPDTWDELRPYRSSGPRIVRGGGSYVDSFSTE